MFVRIYTNINTSFESKWCVLACHQARRVPQQCEICKWVGSIKEQIAGKWTVGSLLGYWHAICIMQWCMHVLLLWHNLSAGGTLFVCLRCQKQCKKSRDKHQQWTNNKWIPFTFQWNSDQGHSNVAAFQCVIKTCKTSTQQPTPALEPQLQTQWRVSLQCADTQNQKKQQKLQTKSCFMFLKDAHCQHRWGFFGVGIAVNVL